MTPYRVWAFFGVLLVLALAENNGFPSWGAVALGAFMWWCCFALPSRFERPR